MSVKNIPATSWNIFQTAAWIETRDFAEVGNCYKRVPSPHTVDLIAEAWQHGKIYPSGEIAGGCRRPLTSEDALDYSIILLTHKGGDLHEVFPHLYAPGEFLPEGCCFVVVRSRRTYPEELAHGPHGGVLPYGGKGRMCHRFVRSLLFNRSSMIEYWSARETTTADKGRNLSNSPRVGFKQIATIAFELELDLTSYYDQVREFILAIHGGWASHAGDSNSGFRPMETAEELEALRRQCRRFIAEARQEGVTKISVNPFTLIASRTVKAFRSPRDRWTESIQRAIFA